MALCRCLGIHAWPKSRSTPYVGYVIPTGFPNTSSICGRCEEAGVIWLTGAEEGSYRNGERIFSFASNVTKVRVDDSGVHK